MANVCPICNNPLRQYGNDFYVCEVCETYFDKNENIVLTEQEWLQTATTEQLAEWICSVHEKCYYCGAKRVSDREHCPFGDGKCRNNKHEFAMWLKQPHHESVTNCNE